MFEFNLKYLRSVYSDTERNSYKQGEGGGGLCAPVRHGDWNFKSATIICDYSPWNLLRVTILVPSIFRSFLHFLENSFTPDIKCMPYLIIKIGISFSESYLLLLLLLNYLLP